MSRWHLALGLALAMVIFGAWGGVPSLLPAPLPSPQQQGAQSVQGQFQSAVIDQMPAASFDPQSTSLPRQSQASILDQLPQAPSLDPRMLFRQQQALAAQRQKELRANAAKLLQLAQQLQTAVNETNQHTLSIDVIHKADQVEKLAKKIKSAMSDGH